MEKSETEASGKQAVDSVRHPVEVGEALDDGFGNFAEMKSDFEVAGSVAAEEVETSGLERDGLEGKGKPERITQGVADGKFHEVGGDFVTDGIVIDGDGDLGEKRDWGANAAYTRGVVATEGGVEAALFLEPEGEKGLNGDPLRASRWLEVQERVVAGNHGGNVSRGVLQVDDGEIVIRVIVVSARLASESHTGEGAKLGLHMGFEEDVEIDERLGDGESLHFLALEDNSFAVLGLIEGGVIVGQFNGGGEMTLAPGAHG